MENKNIISGNVENQYNQYKFKRNIEEKQFTQAVLFEKVFLSEHDFCIFKKNEFIRKLVPFLLLSKTMHFFFQTAKGIITLQKEKKRIFV